MSNIPIFIASVMRSSGRTGVQTHIRTFASYLEENSFPHVVINPFGRFRFFLYIFIALRRVLELINGAAAVFVYRFGHSLILRSELAYYFNRQSECVVYSQCPLSANAALRERKNSKQKVFLVVHFNISQADEWVGMGKIKNEGWLYRKIREFEARVLPGLDGVVYVSDFMRSQVESRIPKIKDIPFAVLPNFVSDPKNFRRECVSCRDLITIGTVEPRKNQIFLIKVIAEANKLGVKFTLTVVGDGPDLHQMKQRAEEAGVDSQISFLGYVQSAAELIHCHKAYIHVALMENLPLVLIEAQAYGVPVFAPQVGGIGETFKDGITGWFIPLDDAQAVAKVLISKLASSQRMLSAGKAARENFLNLFETQRVAANLRYFLLSLSES